MIKSKKYLVYASILYVITLVLNFRYPNEATFGETVFSALKIPTSMNGFQYVGIISFAILLASLTFLSMSLAKYQTRLIILALVLCNVIPFFIANTYQKTLASGIYAVNYERDQSNCQFEMTDESKLHGVCELPFENYRDRDVQFSLTFYDPFIAEGEAPMLAMMNLNGPYTVHLKGKESKLVKIETDIDVSKLENHIESGEANGISIIIVSKGKSRKL